MKDLQNRSQFVAQIVKISQHASEITSLNDREVRHITKKIIFWENRK